MSRADDVLPQFEGDPAMIGGEAPDGVHIYTDKN